MLPSATCYTRQARQKLYKEALYLSWVVNPVGANTLNQVFSSSKRVSGHVTKPEKQSVMEQVPQ